MSRLNRRELLIERMQELEAQGQGCLGCEGTCCTFQANSMLLTPLEAWELMTYLKDHGQKTDALKERLEKTLNEYRLEPKYLNGRRSYLRKTYTCTFFGFKELGCPLPREIKPYGCLAFDSHHPTLKADSNCYSEIDLLVRREELHPEELELNDKLRKDFNLMWEKAPIPNALLDFWNLI